jgi:hypothetical protein
MIVHVTVGLFPVYYCFAFHSSTASTSASDFRTLKSFFKVFIDSQPSTSQYSFVSFSNQVITEIGLNAQPTQFGLFNAIDALTLQGNTGADAAGAISRCQSILPLSTSEAIGVTFLITDVPANDANAQFTAASNIFNFGGIFRFIQVGNNVNPAEVTLLSQIFLSRSLLSFSSYSGFFNVASFLNPLINVISNVAYPYFCTYTFSLHKTTSISK